MPRIEIYFLFLSIYFFNEKDVSKRLINDLRQFDNCFCRHMKKHNFFSFELVRLSDYKCKKHQILPLDIISDKFASNCYKFSLKMRKCVIDVFVQSILLYLQVI
jgi:hypothetical protein